MHWIRGKLRDCVPPAIICGHQFTAISQHQAAARDYLEAYKLQPDNPLINLCVGTPKKSICLYFDGQNGISILELRSACYSSVCQGLL